MRKWLLASFGIALVAGVVAIRSSSESHESITFEFIDSISRQRVPNVSVSIREQSTPYFPAVWNFVEKVGLLKAPSPKHRACAEGILKAYPLVKHPRHRISLSCSAPDHLPAEVYYANGAIHVDEAGLGCSMMIYVVYPTNRVVSIPLQRFILQGLH